MSGSDADNATAAPRCAALGVSVRGASHIANDRPNEDAVATCAAPPVVAVADGHGSRTCSRSADGARMAVAIAREVLAGLDGPFPSADTWEQAIAELAAQWHRQVADALAETPPDAEEAERLGSLPPSRLYGTTLVAAIRTEGWAATLQIGDGDALWVVHGQVERPVPGDPRVMGNETTSLSEPDAALDFRLHARTADLPELILVATDGYANSFRTTGDFNRVATDLLEALADDGADAIAAALPEWLDETSAAGSGDDISVGLLWTYEPTPPQESTS